MKDSQIKELGGAELLRQFPMVLGPNGMELDTEAFNRIRGQTPDNREFQTRHTGAFGPGLNSAPVNVHVTLSWDGDKPIATVVEDSKTARTK